MKMECADFRERREALFQIQFVTQGTGRRPFLCLCVCGLRENLVWGILGYREKDCRKNPFLKWIYAIVILINFDPLCSF